MADKERYFVGPGLRDKLRDTITRVDGLAYGRGVDDIPTRLQSLPTPGSGELMRLGKTTSAWNKGTFATIDLYPAGTPGSESRGADAPTLEDCVNKFADVPADKWVIVALAPNDAWYLIAAEC